MICHQCSKIQLNSVKIVFFYLQFCIYSFRFCQGQSQSAKGTRGIHHVTFIDYIRARATYHHLVI